jgi:hypothetical protein
MMCSMAKASVNGSWLEEGAGGLEADPKPRYRAEDLIYQAWEATGPLRLKLAREALELWPDCADAYVLLSQAAPDLEQARGLLEQGVAAGERALGRRLFAEDAVSSG